METNVFTIGHSRHALDDFVALLRRHSVTALCDVRSTPYSRINSQFNREDFKQALLNVGVVYVYLGLELGARSLDSGCYVDGKVQYDRLAQTELFRKGLDRIREGMKGYRLALMCAEKDPLECHRTILVSRHLDVNGIAVQHILGDGSLESHEQAMFRLLATLKIPANMLSSSEELLAEAYRVQGERIAYVAKKVPTKASVASNMRR